MGVLTAYGASTQRLRRTARLPSVYGSPLNGCGYGARRTAGLRGTARRLQLVLQSNHWPSNCGARASAMREVVLVRLVDVPPHPTPKIVEGELRAARFDNLTAVASLLPSPHVRSQPSRRQCRKRLRRLRRRRQWRPRWHSVLHGRRQSSHAGPMTAACGSGSPAAAC